MAAASPHIAANQAQTFLRLWRELASQVRSDRAFPNRLESLLRRHRQFGSRDRRLYRELTYTAVRFLPWLEEGLASERDDAVQTLVWLAADFPATRLLRDAMLDGWPAAPESVSAKAEVIRNRTSLICEQRVLPEWFAEECPQSADPIYYDRLQQRAPLWLRLQTTDSARVAEEFSKSGWIAEPSPVLENAWRVQGDVDVTKTQAFQNGAVEVQDLGSQMILAAVGVTAGEQWLDACAGAGGKTLQLATLLGKEGKVTAHDIRSAALDELRLRADRAHLNNVRVARKLPSGTFSGVLVDAPCSGSGTWRRAPHLKWSTTPEAVRSAAQLQSQLLSRFSESLAPGGRLVYATCSLCVTENDHVVARFLKDHPNFAPSEYRNHFGFSVNAATGGMTLDPKRYDSDGFYVALLKRNG